MKCSELDCFIIVIYKIMDIALYRFVVLKFYLLKHFTALFKMSEVSSLVYNNFSFLPKKMK